MNSPDGSRTIAKVTYSVANFWNRSNGNQSEDTSRQRDGRHQEKLQALWVVSAGKLWEKLVTNGLSVVGTTTGISLTHALATRRGVGNAFEANCQHRTGIREAIRMIRTVLKTGFVLAFMAMGTPAFAQQNAAVPDAKIPAGATVSTVQPSVAAATAPADNG